jgi:hypothetical protein
VRCLFVADVIPPTLRRLVEFLNEHLDTVEVLAVELPQYAATDADLRAIVPRLVGQTALARAAKGTPPRRSGPQWDEQSFMTAVDERSGPRQGALFSTILRWCKEHDLALRGGKGAQYPSLRAIVHRTDSEHVLFSLWTSESGGAGIEIGFEYLKGHEPFADESRRQEMIDRLNAIPDVQILAERIGGRPSIPLEPLYQESALQQFLSVMEWAVAAIRGTGS